MKSTDIVQPHAMASTFAVDVYSASGTTNFEIPADTSTSATDTCVLDDGFLPITSTDLDDGGIAPERKNFNGLFYLSTDQRNYIQNGGSITFDAAVSTAIGGYPQGAVLDYVNSGNYYKVQSLIDDNTYNFVTTPTYIDNVHWAFLEYGTIKKEDTVVVAEDDYCYRYVVNDGNLDANGNLDLIDAEEATDTTYMYAQSGTYTFTVPTTGAYPIALIGPGGRGTQTFSPTYSMWYVAGGGSGGGYVGDITLDAGTYTIEVGSGQNRNSTVLKDSNDNVLITATAGNNGTTSAFGANGGTGGSVTIASGVTVTSNTVGSNTNHDDGNGYKGNQGLVYGYMGQAIGGASIYNGYGKGGNNVQTGWDGYFEIVIQNQGSYEVNYKVSNSTPLTIVDAQGVKSVLYGVNNDQIANLPDGTYNKFVDTTGTDFLANNIYYQLKVPTSPSLNDVWVKTAEKIEVFKYDGSQWNEYNRVLIGTVTVSSGSVATGGIKNTQLYQNGFDVTTYKLKHYIIEAKSENGLWYRLYNDGWLEQGGNKTNPLTGQNAGNFDIDFFKSFGNTDYQFLRNPVWINYPVQPTSDVYAVGCTVKAYNKVTVGCHGGNYVTSVDWFACGYVS